MKRISQREIANLLGVNVSTVSRALRGLEGVSQELRQKILSLAKEQGYELTEDELEAVSGGAWNNCSSYVRYTKPCPKRSKYVK